MFFSYITVIEFNYAALITLIKRHFLVNRSIRRYLSKKRINKNFCQHKIFVEDGKQSTIFIYL